MTDRPADLPPPAAERDGAGLSNDYLNHYTEALMLIELAAMDPLVGDDLQGWRPVSYLSYFGQSRLRRAGQALLAYEALAPGRKATFEALTRAMDQLVRTAILALRPPCEPDNVQAVVEATAPTLRRLIGRAAAFLNSGGADAGSEGAVEAAQGAIDALMERGLLAEEAA